MVTVTNLPSRPAPVLARTLTSLSALSGGRIILGIGAGAIWDMITKLGIPRHDGGAAVRAMAEAITLIRALSGGGDPVTFDGEFYHVSELDPAAAPAPRVFTGSVGPKSLAVTGQLADGWIPPGGADWLSQSYRESRPRVDAAAAAAGPGPGGDRQRLQLRRPHHPRTARRDPRRGRPLDRRLQVSLVPGDPERFSLGERDGPRFRGDVRGGDAVQRGQRADLRWPDAAVRTSAGPTPPPRSSREAYCHDRAHARAKVTIDRTKATWAEIAGTFTLSAWSGSPAGVARVKGHAMTHEDDLPAEVRRQDEEDELQIAAQLAELRKEHVSAARRRWSDLSKRTRTLLITAAVADGALRVAALIDIQHRPASQIRGRKWIWATAVALVSSAGVVPVSYFVFGQRRES
jgi:alkanesulfonate monooxygenase SsuD/methylene tetrahydromethanopterin reductase-like flavin-dependent oxidoreductase (luciferase family)